MIINNISNARCSARNEEMENRGFDDDFSSACKSTSTEIRESTNINTAGKLFSNGYGTHCQKRNSTNLDAHVYEDISSDYICLGDNTFCNDNPGFSPIPEALGTSPCTDENGISSLFKDVKGSTTAGIAETRITNSEISATDVITRLHRTLTLPVKRSSKVLDRRDQERNRSVRVTRSEKCERDVEGGAEGEKDHLQEHKILGDDLSSSRRRRRKKDCKHCKNKKVIEKVVEPSSVIIEEELYKISSRLHQPILTLPQGKLPNFLTANRSNSSPENSENISTVCTLSNNANSSWNLDNLKRLNYDKNDIQTRLNVGGESTTHSDNKALITPQKNRTTMKVNSIYSQDQWNSKDAPIFFTDIKQHDHFQRAYSLPSRSQTPSSQNRVNLRRSVRGEPPPRPARLDKRRGGWTLHFARPLRSGGCTKSVVVLILVILLLVGVGCTALYILFEPQKLQLIQQYLTASAPNDTTSICDSCTTIRILIDDSNKTTNSGGRIDLETTTTTTTTVILSPETTSIPELNTTEQSMTSTTTTIASINLNRTRYCDDCVLGEVCVALINDEVPICRIGPDPKDPTGCAGLCAINTQRCHRLDVDAFRCAELEHHCLDGEWTCSNGLCIPEVKHCDGHMNCYDHSDEYECGCDLETHFRCGNETSCLPLEKKCDGVINCWDATDEINCTVACPLASEFTCNNGQCISKMRFCDGLPDCDDGSDEPHGCQGRCNKHEFTCGNGRCIAKDLKCNKIDDCGDGTDEQRCRNRFT